MHLGLFSLFGSLFPPIEFVLRFDDFSLPVHALGLLVLDVHLKLLQFRLSLVDLLVLVIKIGLESAKLFEQKFVLELKVLSPSESKSKFT